MSMSSEHWGQLKELFRGAIEHEPQQREGYLDQACAGDSALRAEIEGLLASHDQAENFIETPAFTHTVKAIVASPPEEIAGRRIGSYQLIREIGRGGMGTVYLARRADEQYEKLVAVKVVRRGMDTEDILQRFRNERQILASLDHPNIAHLLDGGTTDDGLPYLVMEYVEGVTLMDYCDGQRLSTSGRLEIFRTICAAVQHAHQNLVIHRDLKPSNILITSEGVPKLLDFGIAKVFHQGISGTAVEHTRTELRVLTPDYASPEQLRGEMLTTTSDVYSLGILLYELLTGNRPYRSSLTPAHELIRIICEQEPPRPSVALTKFKLQQVQARSNSTRDFRSAKSLRGDLDNIILMALRREAARRYVSVSQFSEDILRHLDGLPVLARKDTVKYRMTKFVARNRVAVAAAAIILISLVGGLVATAWQARAARQEKAKAESVNAFLKRLLAYSNPLVNAAGKSDGETTMKDLLSEAAKRLDSPEFSNQLEVKAELEKIIAYSYYGQGRQDLWEQHLRKYIDIQRSLYGENDHRSIEATSNSALLFFHDQNFSESEKTYRRVLPLMRSEYRRGNIDVQEFAEALNNFGYLRRTQGDSKEAEALFRETLTLSARMPIEQHHVIGLTRCTLASTLADQGRFDEALETARQAVDEYRQTGRTGVPDFGFALTVFGGFLTEKGDFDEADSRLNEGEHILRQLQSPSSLWLGDNLRNQAISFYQQNKYDEAQVKLAETEKIYLQSFGPLYDQYPTVLIIKGLILTKTQKAVAGEAILRSAVKLRTDSLPAAHFWIAVATGALGENLMRQKRFAEAEPLLLRSYQSLRIGLGTMDPRTIEAQRRVLTLYDSWPGARRKPEI